jgi:hypothetical protein
MSIIKLLNGDFTVAACNKTDAVIETVPMIMYLRI